MAIPYAFAWVLITWAITDKSILRKPLPYLGVFIVLLIEKTYWTVFYQLFPPWYNSEAFAVGVVKIARPFVDWIDLHEKAYHFLVVIEFFIMFVFFMILWYLSRPRDFTKKIYNRRTLLIVFGSFFMTMPLWLGRVVFDIGGYEFVWNLISNWDLVHWFNFLVTILPFVIGFLILAVVITNIKKSIRFGLYLVIFVFLLIPNLPINGFSYWPVYQDWVHSLFYYFVFALSYFIVILSLVLLSKTKYLEL